MSLSKKWVTYLEDAKTPENQWIPLNMGSKLLPLHHIITIPQHLLEMKAKRKKLAWKLTIRSPCMKKRRKKVHILLEILIAQKMLRQQLILHAAKARKMKKKNVKKMVLLLRLKLKKTLWTCYLTRLVLAWIRSKWLCKRLLLLLMPLLKRKCRNL